MVVCVVVCDGGEVGGVFGLVCVDVVVDVWFGWWVVVY